MANRGDSAEHLLMQTMEVSDHMATTETSTLRTIAGVIGVGSLALFGATACDNGDTDTDTDDQVENGEVDNGDTDTDADMDTDTDTDTDDDMDDDMDDD